MGKLSIPLGSLIGEIYPWDIHGYLGEGLTYKEQNQQPIWDETNRTEKNRTESDKADLIRL